MKPSELSNLLRRISASIDNSSNPSRKAVIRHLSSLISKLSSLDHARWLNSLPAITYDIPLTDNFKNEVHKLKEYKVSNDLLESSLKDSLGRIGVSLHSKIFKGNSFNSHITVSEIKPGALNRLTRAEWEPLEGESPDIIADLKDKEKIGDFLISSLAPTGIIRAYCKAYEFGLSPEFHDILEKALQYYKDVIAFHELKKEESLMTEEEKKELEIMAFNKLDDEFSNALNEIGVTKGEHLFNSDGDPVLSLNLTPIDERSNVLTNLALGKPETLAEIPGGFAYDLLKTLLHSTFYASRVEM